ncbi:MmgE/PrpD family protein [Frankia sp. R82]|uniref:MmgE/PrpD family protein n=1 Tax=Frankia sp. R82 TaxID=2950553 RepID=UPI002043CAB2|nr:MmgE/PrpD family protein [Frankia sp. R82]MCM3882910.1 MmgE/PrpD family protein [Frankia sp. R82]
MTTTPNQDQSATYPRGVGRPASGQGSLIQQVAEFAVGVRERGLPAERRHRATGRLLDVVGNSLAASGEPIATIVRTVVDGWGGDGPASVPGSSRRYPAASAALLGGTLAHALDFDDTHLPSVLHPSATVVPVALAAAERAGHGGAAMLDAIAVGNEFCVRLGLAGYDPSLGNSIFFERGQHATAICGAVAGAVAAAMLAGLDAEGVAHAAGIAASMGSGLLEANRTGGTAKRVHTGWAAHSAIVASELAAAGLTGPPTVLEGRFGFFQAWCGDQAVPQRVTAGLGEVWESDDVHTKPYPCNHFTHAGIDAALDLRDRGVNPAEIVGIELGAPSAVLRTIAEPAALKAAPPSGYAAAFSGPYTVAAEVTCVPDEACDSLFPRHLPAVLRVEMTDGRRHEARVERNRGGPDRPLDDQEIATKFRLGARTRLDGARVEDLHDTLARAAEADSARDLLAACSPAASKII